jgi:hypothetical protein
LPPTPTLPLLTTSVTANPAQPTDKPPVIVASDNVAVPPSAALVELRLGQIDFAAIAKNGIQSAQIFDKLATDVADALNLPHDRVKVIKLRDDNGSVVAQLAILPDSSNQVPTNIVNVLQSLVQDPNSSLYRNGQIAKYIDPSYKITTQAQNASSQLDSSQSGDRRVVVICVAVVLSVLLYAGLTAAFIHTYRRNKRRRERNMAATGYFATPQPQA